MPNTLGVVGVLCLLAFPLAADPAVTVYYNSTDWTTAAMNLSNSPIQTAKFADNGQPTSPDVSLHDWGYYGPNSPLAWYWTFREGVAHIGTNHNDMPYLTFSEPIYGFGADMSYGYGLEIGAGSGFVTAGTPGCTYGLVEECGYSGFFGITSTAPFDEILFQSSGREGVGFTLSNMVFAPATPAPEPATVRLSLMALALIGVCVRTSKRLHIS